MTFGLNPAQTSASAVLSGSNKIITVASANWHRAEAFARTGKRYFEAALTSGSNAMISVCSKTGILNWQSNESRLPSAFYVNSNTVRNNTLTTNISGYASWAAGDRVMAAYDPDARKVWFGKNGVWVGDPATNSGGLAIAWAGEIFPVIVGNASTVRIYTEPAELQYAPPSGFLAHDTRYTLTGVVRDKTGALAARTVTVIRESDGTVQGRQTTGADGAFSIPTPYNEAHTLIVSGEADRNSLVFAGVMPA